MTETRRRELKEYGESLCMVAHGGEVPGRAILELVFENETLQRTIDDLRRPEVAQPERE